MKKSILPLFLLILLVFSCKEKPKETTETVATTPIEAKPDPKETIKKLFEGIKSGSLPDENLCLEKDGYDITKIDKVCLEKYQNSLKATNVFSSIYLGNIKAEFEKYQTEIDKEKFASGLDADRYTLSQDPPSADELIAGLEKAVVSTTENKSTIVVSISKPYPFSMKYFLDFEENTWKISSFENNTPQ